MASRLGVPSSVELTNLVRAPGVGSGKPTAVGRIPTENDRQHSGLKSAAKIRGVVLLESISNVHVNSRRAHTHSTTFAATAFGELYRIEGNGQ